MRWKDATEEKSPKIKWNFYNYFKVNRTYLKTIVNQIHMKLENGSKTLQCKNILNSIIWHHQINKFAN